MVKSLTDDLPAVCSTIIGLSGMHRLAPVDCSIDLLVKQSTIFRFRIVLQKLE